MLAAECRRGWGHHKPHSPLCSMVLWKVPSERKCIWRSCNPGLLKILTYILNSKEFEEEQVKSKLFFHVRFSVSLHGAKRCGPCHLCSRDPLPLVLSALMSQGWT